VKEEQQSDQKGGNENDCEIRETEKRENILPVGKVCRVLWWHRCRPS
jgi:hypothetical protein